jgi:hypothetical protein
MNLHTKNLATPFTVALAFATSLCHLALAQEPPVAKPVLPAQALNPHGKVQLRGAFVPSRTIEGQSNAIKQSEFALTSSFPLFQTVEMPQSKTEPSRDQRLDQLGHLPKGPSIWGMTLNPAVGGQHFHVIGNSERDLHLYDGKLGFGGYHLSSSGEMYFASLGVSVVGEWDSPRALGWLPSGFFVGTHKLDQSLRLLYGAAFSFAYGRGLPLPILGLSWKISDSSSLLAILPFILKYKARLSQTFDFNAFLTPAGTQSRFRNKGSYASSSESTLTLKEQGFRLGGGVTYKASHNWKLTAEAGVLGARKYTISDSTQDLDVFRPSKSAFVLAGVTYRLGGSPKGGVTTDFEDF